MMSKSLGGMARRAQPEAAMMYCDAPPAPGMMAEAMPQAASMVMPQANVSLRGSHVTGPVFSAITLTLNLHFSPFGHCSKYQSMTQYDPNRVGRVVKQITSFHTLFPSLQHWF